VAREEDESTGYVLSRALLLKLSRLAPATAKELCAAVGGGSALALRRAPEVLAAIAAGKEQGVSWEPACMCLPASCVPVHGLG
jgi:HRDC domain